MSARMTTASLFAAGLVVAILWAAPTASGFIATNTIDRQATYTKQGKKVRVKGPIACTRGEWVSLRATVEQTVTHTRATGRWQHLCTGEIQRWRVRARVRGGKPFGWHVRARPGLAGSFERGRARACAVAKTHLGRRVTDRRAWCARVTLSPRS